MRSSELREMQRKIVSTAASWFRGSGWRASSGSAARRGAAASRLARARLSDCEGLGGSGALVSQSPTQGETRRGNGGSMVGVRLRHWRAAAAEGRRVAGPGMTHRQRERMRLGPVTLVREAARSMELQAVEESRVDEDDMRAVTCGGEESAEEGYFF